MSEAASSAELRALHHIGFVVPGIRDALPGFGRFLGSPSEVEIVLDPVQRVRVAFLAPGGGHPMVELIEPAGPRSPVEALAQAGGGLHHLCYEVEDLARHIEVLRAEGAVRVRSPQPATAFQGRRIAWVLTPEKLLVELLER